MKLLTGWLRNGGQRRQFPTICLALVLILVAAATAGLTTPGRACGIITHHNIAERAAATLPGLDYPVLMDILADYPGIVSYGSVWPDWGYTLKGFGWGDIYGNYSDAAHEHALTAAYLDYLKPTLSNPYSEDDRKAIAFLLGIIAHNEADNPFHFGPNAFLWIAMNNEGQTDQALFEEDIDLMVRNSYEGGWGATNACDGWEVPAKAKQAIAAAYTAASYPEVDGFKLDGGRDRQNTLCGWEKWEPFINSHVWTEQNFLNWPDGGLLDMSNHTAAVWMQTWDELSETTYSLYLPAVVR